MDNEARVRALSGAVSCLGEAARNMVPSDNDRDKILADLVTVSAELVKACKAISVTPNV